MSNGGAGYTQGYEYTITPGLNFIFEVWSAQAASGSVKHTFKKTLYQIKQIILAPMPLGAKVPRHFPRFKLLPEVMTTPTPAAGGPGTPALEEFSLGGATYTKRGPSHSTAQPQDSDAVTWLAPSVQVGSTTYDFVPRAKIVNNVEYMELDAAERAFPGIKNDVTANRNGKWNNKTMKDVVTGKDYVEAQAAKAFWAE